MQPVLVERVGQVQVVTINRPEARNAVDLRVALGIAAALDELDERQELRAGVVTGAGGSFSAGMDLKAFLRGELGAWYDVLAVWRDWADDVRGRALDCGHYLAEEAPEETYRELAAFFAG